jgi:hypothetical protein
MNDYFESGVDETTDAENISRVFGELDTSQRSPLLRLLGPPKASRSVTFARYFTIWAITVVVTYAIPLLWIMFTQETLLERSDRLLLPYFMDVNIAMMCLVSTPVLLALHLRERFLIPSTISSLAEEGVAACSTSTAKAFTEKWTRRFAKTNFWGLWSGLIAAAICSYLGYLAVLDFHGLGWQTVGEAPGSLNGPGVYNIFIQLGVFWFVLSQHVFRMIATIVMLRDFSRTCAVTIQPLHPDGVGGLKPIGILGLHNQLIVGMIGINIGTMFITFGFLGQEAPLFVGVACGVAYVLIAPFVFVGPLIPFRPHMLREKRRFLKTISRQFDADLSQLFSKLDSDEVGSAKLEKLEKLSQIHKSISALPEWPFDASTLRKFLAVLISPIFSVFISWLFAKIVERG